MEPHTHLVKGPEESLLILNPFKVARCHPTRVYEHVEQHQDNPLAQAHIHLTNDRVVGSRVMDWLSGLFPLAG